MAVRLKWVFRVEDDREEEFFVKAALLALENLTDRPDTRVGRLWAAVERADALLPRETWGELERICGEKAVADIVLELTDAAARLGVRAALAGRERLEELGTGLISRLVRWQEEDEADAGCLEP